MKCTTAIAAAIALLGLCATAAQAATAVDTGASAPSLQSFVGAQHSPLPDLLAKSGRGKDGTKPEDDPHPEDLCDDHGNDNIVCGSSASTEQLARRGRGNDDPVVETDDSGADPDHSVAPEALLAKGKGRDHPEDDGECDDNGTDILTCPA